MTRAELLGIIEILEAVEPNPDQKDWQFKADADGVSWEASCWVPLVAGWRLSWGVSTSRNSPDGSINVSAQLVPVNRRERERYSQSADCKESGLTKTAQAMRAAALAYVAALGVE